MRSIWKGSISFGLVSIAVKVYSATEEKDIAFHQVHREDGGRIKYKRICSIDGEEVPYNDIAKGYELPDGDMVVLTDDDLAELPLTSSREIDVLQFVPLEQVDPIYFNKSYYLEPDARAAKAYVLLRDTLEKSGRVAVVKVALRRREALATLRVRERSHHPRDHVVARRDSQPRVRLPRRGRRRPACRDRDGERARRVAVGRLRPGRLHRPVPRRARVGRRGEDRGPRPGAGARHDRVGDVGHGRRPGRGIAGEHRGGEGLEGVRWRVGGDGSAAPAGGKKAAVKKLTPKAAPAKKAVAARAGGTKVAAKSAPAKTATKAPAAAAARAAAERKPARTRRSA